MAKRFQPRPDTAHYSRRSWGMQCGHDANSTPRRVAESHRVWGGVKVHSHRACLFAQLGLKSIHTGPASFYRSLCVCVFLSFLSFLQRSIHSRPQEEKRSPFLCFAPFLITSTHTTGRREPGIRSIQIDSCYLTLLPRHKAQLSPSPPHPGLAPSSPPPLDLAEESRPLFVVCFDFAAWICL